MKKCFGSSVQGLKRMSRVARCSSRLCMSYSMLPRRFYAKDVRNFRRILVCGVDEAGRGPILGPLVIGTCVLTPEVERVLQREGVKDSKELSAKKREQLYAFIKEQAVRTKTLHIPADEIDRRRESGENLNKLQEHATLQLLGSIFQDEAVAETEVAMEGLHRDPVYGETFKEEDNGEGKINIGSNGEASVTLYLDSVDVVPGRYGGVIQRYFPSAQVIAKHKADSEFVCRELLLSFT